jgi:hypothetical protein
VRDRRRVSQIVRQRSHFFDHVEDPHNIAVRLARQFFIGNAVVLFIAKALRVEANQLRPIRNVIEAIAFDQR